MTGALLSGGGAPGGGSSAQENGRRTRLPPATWKTPRYPPNRVSSSAYGSGTRRTGPPGASVTRNSYSYAPSARRSASRSISKCPADALAAIASARQRAGSNVSRADSGARLRATAAAVGAGTRSRPGGAAGAGMGASWGGRAGDADPARVAGVLIANIGSPWRMGPTQSEASRLSPATAPTSARPTAGSYVTAGDLNRRPLGRQG